MISNNGGVGVLNPGRVGMGTIDPAPRTELHIVHDDGENESEWGVRIDNSSVSNHHGGIRLGSEGFLEMSNTAGSGSPIRARLGSGGAWTVTSDRRVKKSIEPLEPQTSSVLKLKPVRYRNLRDPNQEIKRIGFIAQDVERTYPQLVVGQELKTLDYASLITPTLAVVQEQEKLIHVLREALAQRRARLEVLKEKLSNLEENFEP